MKKRVLFIGSYIDNATDGQNLKTKTYLDLFAEEGIDFIFVNTSNWKKRPFSIYFQLKKNIKKVDIIFLMVSFRGSRTLIPLINSLNRNKKPFIYSMVGTGPLAPHIRKIGPEKGMRFVNEHEYGKFKDRFLKKELKKLNYILPETVTIAELYKDFYDLNNCYVVTNFRKVQPIKTTNDKSKCRKLVFLSRIVSEKGVFDIIEGFKNAQNKTNKRLSLDIYGKMGLSKDEELRFKKELTTEIKYCGAASFENVLDTISKYDLFCFPTKCPQEGAPGVLVEAILAGVPILSSNFPQAKDLLKDRQNCLLYRFTDVNDLENKLIEIVENDFLYKKLLDGVKESQSVFEYKQNKELLFKILFENV